jgi:hypothetical protein
MQLERELREAPDRSWNYWRARRSRHAGTAEQKFTSLATSVGPESPYRLRREAGHLDSASSQRGIGIVSVAPLGAELVFSVLDQHLSFMTVIATPVSSVYRRVDGLSLSAIGPVVLILMGDFPLIVVEHDEILGSCHELNSRR